MPIKNAGYLNGIEFKTIREELGLTQAELMRLMGIKNYQTIVRWEKGHNVISERACDSLIALLKENLAQMINNTNEIVERYKRTCYADFALILYPESPLQNAAVRKAYCQLLIEGKKAHIVRFNEESYTAYLKSKGAEDSTKNREQWAVAEWKKGEA